MPSEQAKEIVSQIIGTTCITSEKFDKGCEIVDAALEAERKKATVTMTGPGMFKVGTPEK